MENNKLHSKHYKVFLTDSKLSCNKVLLTQSTSVISSRFLTHIFVLVLLIENTIRKGQPFFWCKPVMEFSSLRYLCLYPLIKLFLTLHLKTKFNYFVCSLCVHFEEFRFCLISYVLLHISAFPLESTLLLLEIWKIYMPFLDFMTKRQLGFAWYFFVILILVTY